MREAVKLAQHAIGWGALNQQPYWAANGPYAAELERLRTKAWFSAVVERLKTRTPAELREYEPLMRIPKAPTK